MSLTADSPASSSSNDDDFIAFLDDELEEDSLDSLPGEKETVDTDEDIEEKVEDDGSDEEEEDLEGVRVKRLKVDNLVDRVEMRCSTSLATTQQELDAPGKKKACSHPVLYLDMCVICGQHTEVMSAVALGYIHKGLKIGTEEMVRLRGADLQKSLRNKKLYLVLDLDHTLLNSSRLVDISAEEEHLMSRVDSLQDTPSGSLFKVDKINMMTKLRPFVRNFLKEASSMYEMYIYTMGERAYALKMAELLDPEKMFFHGKVISHDDCTHRHQKGLDVIVGADSAIVILDDTEIVWSKHKENLILMERYHYFASSVRHFGPCGKSLSELKRDESETEGALANILNVLRRLHEMFFNVESDASLTSRDVRQVLKTIKQEVLKGCKLVFSQVWKRGELAENQKLWEMAEQLGASCTTNLGPSVTHVISTDKGTEKACWAVKNNKFLVHPRWIEVASYLWKRQPEEQFPFNYLQNL